MNDTANEHLLNALYQVIAHGKLLGQMRSTFSKLKLTTVQKVCTQIEINTYQFVLTILRISFRHMKMHY